MENTNYLGLELDGPLSVNVNGFGSGSVDGSTRHLIMTQIEELRGAVILQAMKESDPKVRQVMSWCNRDKLRTAWLQSLPEPDVLNN